MPDAPGCQWSGFAPRRLAQAGSSKQSQRMTVTLQPFGQLPDGRGVTVVRLSNASIAVEILTLGATLHTLTSADRAGAADDVLLGFDTLGQYLADTQYLGVTIGRTTNRIAGARFNLDGRTYQLDANEGPNQLHGGPAGLHRKLWDIVAAADDPPSLHLRTTSPDGEGGYPGNAVFDAVFALDGNALTLDYSATCDAPTMLAMTNHAYFNLSGARSGCGALGHQLTLFADAFTPVKPDLIPTGAITPVAGTSRDFRAARSVASTGFDDNFVVRGEPGALRPAARLADPVSGRVLEIHATAPGLQFYSGGYLGGLAGRGGRVHAAGDAVALEPQAFPDAPNQPGFPGVRLDPGETYRSRIAYRFGVEA